MLQSKVVFVEIRRYSFVVTYVALNEPNTLCFGFDEESCYEVEIYSFFLHPFIC